MANAGFFVGSTLISTAPARSLPQCGACGLLKSCNTPKMPVSGAGARGVLFVGDSPHLEDDRKGKYFTGESGQHLRGVLRGLGFELSRDGWSTASIICHPKRAGGAPSDIEVEYCRPNLLKTIKELNPNVIVPLGKSANRAVIGAIWKEDPGPIERWVGWRIPCHAFNAWVCPTWDSVSVMRAKDSVLTMQLRAHLKWAIQQDEKPWPEGPPDYAKEVTKMHDPAKAAAWLRKCATMKTGAIAWDYETDRLKPDGDGSRIFSCAVAYGHEEPERCIAYPWHGEAITATQELLRSPIPKIASNLKFEERWTKKEFGHRVRAWAWDTMLAANIADNRPNTASVKFQAFVRLGMPVWNDKVEPFLKTKGDEVVNRILREIDINDLLRYNGLDSLLEFRVAIHQMKELNHPIPWEI